MGYLLLCVTSFFKLQFYLCIIREVVWHRHDVLNINSVGYFNESPINGIKKLLHNITQWQVNVNY